MKTNDDEIEYGSAWEHKDGGLYQAFDTQPLLTLDGTVNVIVYKKIYGSGATNGETFVRTVKHFKSSFKEVQ